MPTECFTENIAKSSIAKAFWKRWYSLKKMKSEWLKTEWDCHYIITVTIAAKKNMLLH